MRIFFTVQIDLDPEWTRNTLVCDLNDFAAYLQARLRDAGRNGKDHVLSVQISEPNYDLWPVKAVSGS